MRTYSHTATQVYIYIYIYTHSEPTFIDPSPVLSPEKKGWIEEGESGYGTRKRGKSYIASK